MRFDIENMKKIALFTGTRAEYGLMRTLILKLIDNNKFDFNLLVSATHLNDGYGKTIKEIENDGVTFLHKLPIKFNNPRELDMPYQTADTIKVISKALNNIKPKYLILLGDRYETFAAASAAHLLGIKIVHLHGGETTLGAIDDKLRNAISQLSSIHFTSADIHKQKVQKMILSKIKDRENAKNNKNYELADKIRDELSNEGIDIKDIKDKTIWNYK